MCENPCNFDDCEGPCTDGFKVELFTAQADEFIAKGLEQLNFETLSDVVEAGLPNAHEVEPVVVQDFRNLKANEVSQMEEQYFGPHANVHFVVMNPTDAPSSGHPLLEICTQLQDHLPLSYPVEHPMEKHPEALSRFGNPDGTLKIYDLDTKDGSNGYREQAETSEEFLAHNDGLGYAGAVEAVALYADSAPVTGGYTFFSNFVHKALYLAGTDEKAFRSLFLPDAMTALRPRGKGAIRVKTPICFINEQDQPQVFFRVQTGEYQISWRKDVPALQRGISFLNEMAKPFAAGSTFVHLMRKGQGSIARNGFVVHGRTAFLNGAAPDEKRILARKWFMTAKRHTQYKHVPGMHIKKTYASIYPELFGEARLYGDWNYRLNEDRNVKNFAA
ncbi:MULTISPECIES: TauD/TfdA family dioxygenase [unclassified Ruegeria]|uniref:TauD/TfdA family dioxygenase n=1 Tax=unclassified Ruegeria TaxID=2625375 RepID=UPI001488AB63|nr:MULTISPECIES: TauD/TfdA family dioxygenase [unclassified Ruegeria]